MRAPVPQHSPPADGSPRGWIALHRGERTHDLLADHAAFALLAILALRARWQDTPNVHGLRQGEALLGDWRACGFRSQKAYRCAKDRLTKYQLAHFRAAHGATSGAWKGTIGKLADSTVFSLFAPNADSGKGEDGGEDKGGDGATTGRGRGDKHTRNYKEHTETDKERESGSPSLDDVLSYSRELGHPADDARRFHNTRTAAGWKKNGRPIAAWKADFRLWMDRFTEHIRTHPAPAPAADTAASRAAAAELELLADLRANVGTWREAGKWASGFDPASVRKGAVARHGRMAGPLVDKIIAELEGAA
jgi:hypothetical protein